MRLVRRSKGVSQGAFELLTSRVYVSAVERGLKQPTLPKVDQFAEVIGVHPLTILAFAYLKRLSFEELQQLLEQVKLEALDLCRGKEVHEENSNLSQCVD